MTATRFGKVMSSGRTKPCLVYCENEEDEEVEFVVKLTGSQAGVRGMVCEMIASQFAADLGLRVPESCLVEITEEFAAAVPNLEAAETMGRSIGWNFATKKLPPSHAVVLPGKPLPAELRKAAAEIFAFDAIIQNPDRGATNPNCLTNGNELVILDHDLAFSFLAGVLFWKPPWESRDLDFLKEHVFYELLFKTPVDLSRIGGSVEALKEERIRTYGAILPPGWSGAGDSANPILDYIFN